MIPAPTWIYVPADGSCPSECSNALAWADRNATAGLIQAGDPTNDSGGFSLIRWLPGNQPPGSYVQATINNVCLTGFNSQSWDYAILGVGPGCGGSPVP